MRGMFESVTRMALEEIVLNHTKDSKFGHLLTEEGLQSLVNRLHEFFLVSREMKTKGDRVLSGQPTTRTNQR